MGMVDECRKRLTCLMFPTSFNACAPGNVGRELTNPVRTVKVAAVSVVSVATDLLGHTSFSADPLLHTQ